MFVTFCTWMPAPAAPSAPSRSANLSHSPSAVRSRLIPASTAFAGHLQVSKRNFLTFSTLFHTVPLERREFGAFGCGSRLMADRLRLIARFRLWTFGFEALVFGRFRFAAQDNAKHSTCDARRSAIPTWNSRRLQLFPSGLRAFAAPCLRGSIRNDPQLAPQDPRTRPGRSHARQWLAFRGSPPNQRFTTSGGSAKTASGLPAQSRDLQTNPDKSSLPPIRAPSIGVHQRPSAVPTSYTVYPSSSVSPCLCGSVLVLRVRNAG